MLRECIQTVEEVNGDMDEGQPRFITTVLTCEGDLQDPSFPNRLESLVGKLNRLISEEKEPFCVQKVEPWNSVRVTFTIPWDAALRLRQLAQQGDQVLRDLGILSVQIEGDQVITLTLANRYSEPQELVFKTSSSTDASSEVPGFGLELPEGSSSSTSAIGHLLSKAIKPSADTEIASEQVGNAGHTCEESAVSKSVAFQSPNVVAPSSQSPPPFKTNAAALMSQKSYTQNPVSSGPFPFASMTYAMNTKHAAANSQSTKHIQGCSSRFPLPSSLPRSASSAWIPYVSHKAVASSSSATTSIPSSTNCSQSNLLSASQPQYSNVTYSSADFSVNSEVEGAVVTRTTKANNALSSPLLVNLLQNETSSKFSRTNVSPVSSPTLQPPVKRKRKPRKPKDATAVSTGASRSDVVNYHTNSSPASMHSESVMVSQHLNVVTTSKIQPLSSYFAVSLPEEQTFILNKSRSPLHRENSVLPNNVPFQSFANSNISVRNFQASANSLHDSVNVVCTSTSSAMDHAAKTSSPATDESKKLATDGTVNSCATPFPSPPPSADGKVKHLINPFTGHLEPMPSDEDEDDECIGSLSLFPELEMMDTNDGAESDKNISDRCEDKQKLPVPDSIQDSQITINTHPVKKDVVDALMCRKPDVYTVRPHMSSGNGQSYSFTHGKNINPSDLLKSSSAVQVAGGIPREFKKSFLQKDAFMAVENSKLPARPVPPATNSNSPLPAQVSQVDLSFLQPHLQNWKAAQNKGKTVSFASNTYAKSRVTENFSNLSRNFVKAKLQENGKLENSSVINSAERPKYSCNLLSSSKPLNTINEISKGSHTVSDSYYALKSRLPEHNLKLPSEYSVGPYKPFSNVDISNLPVKDISTASYNRPAAFFNKLTVLDVQNVDRANNTLRQVCGVNIGSPQNISFKKLQLDDKDMCLSKSGFPTTSPGNLETNEKDAAGVSKANEGSVEVSHPVESLSKKLATNEGKSNFNSSLNIESYSSAASYSTSSPSIVVSSCERPTILGSQANPLFGPSPDSSDTKDFKRSSLERHAISPESNPHFETPPDSRSPISSISSNDKLTAESVNSFDMIRKETLFNPGKHEKFLADMMDSSVEIQRHNEKVSEQCSMSSLIISNSTIKPEISMHKKCPENIPLCETLNSDKAIFSINNSLNTTYSGNGKIFVNKTEKSSKELAVLNEGKSNEMLSSTILSLLQDPSKSLELNPPNKNSLNYLTCSDDLKKSGVGSPQILLSSVFYQTHDDNSLNQSLNYGKKDCADSSSEKINQQEGHFSSGSVTKSSKTYVFTDNNISKPPEQLPLEIFENSESESQSPMSLFDGENHNTYFAGKDKQSVTVPSTVCAPIESHLSSQDHVSSTAPLDSKERDVSSSSPRCVSHEMFLGTSQEPLHTVLFENNRTAASPSELSGGYSKSQSAAVADRLVNNPLSYVMNNMSSNVYTRGSATTTSVANVPSSVSLPVPTVPKSTCESTRKFANGTAFKSYHIEVSHHKNIDGLANLEPFQPPMLKNPASLQSGALMVSSQTGGTSATVKHKNEELMNSFPEKVSSISFQEELQSSEFSSALRNNYPSSALRNNYPLLAPSDEFGKSEDTFSTDFVEANSNGCTGHMFSSRYDNRLSFNISDSDDSKLLLSRTGEIDSFSDYNALAQKLISSVDDKLVSEIKCKLNISRDRKLSSKISNVDSSFSPNLQHTESYENNNCVTIVSAEELHTASKKSNRSYSEDSFGDSSVESPYRNSDPLELEYNICDYKFDSVDRSLRPKHRNGSTCLIEDETNSPSDISSSLLFTSASDISGSNAKMVFQSAHEKIKALNGRKDVNAACAIVEIRKASLFDGTKLLNPRKKCILSPRIGGEEQLQGIKRRRLSADSLR